MYVSEIAPPKLEPELIEALEPNELVEPIIDPDEKLGADDRHVPSACFVDPDGHGAVLVELCELKELPEPKELTGAEL